MTKFEGSLDTNVLLRALLNDIPEQHLLAKTLIEKPGARYCVADTALIELVFVLERHYRFNREQIADALEGLVMHPKLSCNKSVLLQSAKSFIVHRSLSFEDCYLAQCAKETGSTPLWTFDKRLASQCEEAEQIKKK